MHRRDHRRVVRPGDGDRHRLVVEGHAVVGCPHRIGQRQALALVQVVERLGARSRTPSRDCSQRRRRPRSTPPSPSACRQRRIVGAQARAVVPEASPRSRVGVTASVSRHRPPSACRIRSGRHWSRPASRRAVARADADHRRVVRAGDGDRHRLVVEGARCRRSPEPYRSASGSRRRRDSRTPPSPS